MELQPARKSLFYAILVFVMFVGFGLFVLRCDWAAPNSSQSLWNQLQRRLFDDDVPQSKNTSVKEYDMTGI